MIDIVQLRIGFNHKSKNYNSAYCNQIRICVIYAHAAGAKKGNSKVMTYRTLDRFVT